MLDRQGQERTGCRGGGASGHREMRDWAGLEDGGDEVGGSNTQCS